MNFSKVRAIRNGIFFFIWLGFLFGPYVVLHIFNYRGRHVVSRLFFKGCLKLTGIRLNVHGRAHSDTVLFAANHASYLDILMLGALLSDSVFVAKAEVSQWPVFGFLARLARTIFIQRTGLKALEQTRVLGRHINQGGSLILFPEGTSTDGSYVNSFKSSLFASLEFTPHEAWVQPVTLAYARHKNGLPLAQGCRENFTWFGEQTLAPHLWRVFGLQGCEVDVVFHEPLHRNHFDNRKHLANACHQVICDTLRISLDQSGKPYEGHRDFAFYRAAE